MYALPDPSTASAVAESKDVPPMKVEYASAEPAGLSFVTKASTLPFWVVSNAPGVVGKFVESASPATYAAPVPSTAIPLPRSKNPLVLKPPR